MLLKNIIHIWIKHKKLLIMKLECIFNKYLVLLMNLQNLLMNVKIILYQWEIQ